MKVNQVDWFYTVPMISIIPVGLFGLYFVDMIGLKKTLWICTSCCTIGSLIQLTTLFHDGSNYDDCKESINGIVIDADEWFQFNYVLFYSRLNLKLMYGEYNTL